MILELIVKILNQSLWNFCIKKGETLYLIWHKEYPGVKQNHCKSF